MKIVFFSEKVLEHMVIEFTSSNRDLFYFEDFTEIYPDVNEEFLAKSLYLLEKEKLVTMYHADNIPYMTMLNPLAIKNCEENALLEKGYRSIKEIKFRIS